MLKLIPLHSFSEALVVLPILRISNNRKLYAVKLIIPKAAKSQKGNCSNK